MCVGANEVLAVIEEEGMLENARAVGGHALEVLNQLGSPLIAQVRGVGLMLGITLVPDFAERAKLPPGKLPSIFMVERLHEAGLLVIPSGSHALRWLPPLNVTSAQIDEAARILQHSLASLG